MKRTSSARRVPRKIGNDDDAPSQSGDSTQYDGHSGRPQESAVKRPPLAKNKKRPSSRLSFGAGEGPAESGDGNVGGSSSTPKKSTLSRIAIENRARSSLAPALAPVARREEEDRPIYSKDYLAELRNSTPTTPKDLKPDEADEVLAKELDIAAKFGPLATLSKSEPSAIPTQAEIQEKKERRARLAQEQKAAEFISLEDDENWASDDDDEFRTSKREIQLRPKEKYPETRLVPDDEDIAEGFEEFTEDGRIALSRKAEREAAKRKRAEIAEMIAQAEGGSSDEDEADDSEKERNEVYEANQSRAGAYGRRQERIDEGARTPPRIAPLPNLDDVLGQLQAELIAKQRQKEMMMKKLEEICLEKLRVAKDQDFVQENLKKTGEEYEKLRQDAGMAAMPTNETGDGKVIVNRGLDSLGATPLATPSGFDDDMEANAIDGYGSLA